MNKTKLFKLINELKENINKDLKDYPESRLYIQSWVIGGLNMIEYKAKVNHIIHLVQLMNTYTKILKITLFVKTLMNKSN